MNPTDAPSRYRLFKKGAYGTFYIEDVLSRRQTSLKTKDKKDAERLYQAHCECAEAPDRAYRVGIGLRRKHRSGCRHPNLETSC